MADELRGALEREDWTVSVTETAAAGDAAAAAEESTGGKIDLVVAIGGDGTVQEIADALAGDPQAPLIAHLPAGTTNAIARAFGLTNDVAELVRMLHDEVKVIVDLGRVVEHDKHFVLSAAVGGPARFVTGAPRELKNRFGFGAYLIAALRTIVKPDRSHVKITHGENTVRRRANGLVVTNVTRLARPSIDLLPEGSVSDGQLDLAIVRAPTLLSWLGMLTRVLRRQAREADELELHQCTHCHIEAVPPMEVQVDGEFVGHTPVTIEVVPHAFGLVARPQAE